MKIKYYRFKKTKIKKLIRPAGKLVLLLITLILSTKAAAGAGYAVELQNKIRISETKSLLARAFSFCITEDELFIFPDSAVGDVKIYRKSGKCLELMKILGKKGFGPGEFVEPVHCCYDRNEKKFAVMDFGQRKIFIYDRIGKTGFKRVNEVFCLSLCYDIRLNKGKLFVSGYKADKASRPFDLYYEDLTNNETSFLLPSYQKYGLESFHDYEIKYRRRPDLKAIGINGRFDIQGNNIYFAWEGDLKIIELNLKTKKMRFFGEKTPGYIKPSASKKRVDFYRNGDFKSLRREWAGMSFVRNVFANPEYVLLVYEGPLGENRESNFRAQFYNIKGEFREEIPIPGQPDNRMYLDTDKEILYSLSSETDGEKEEYFILEYKIRK